MSTIPAGLFVEVEPSVLSASGGAVDVVGLVLTKNTRVPIGTVMSFPDALSVSSFFGPSDPLATLANVYFAGFVNATARPGALFITQYPLAAVAAYMRGGNISGLSLTTLQGFSGTLSITIDGSVKSGSVNLSAATSFSNAAQLIATALGIEGVQTAVATSVSLATTVMTVNSGITGTFAVGNLVVGTGIPSGTYIASLGTGTGGAGTYNLSASCSTESNETVTAFNAAVQFDSVSGAFEVFSGTTGAASTMAFATGGIAAELLLTQATGAVLSQGANAAVPAAFMAGVIAVTTDWVTFMTAFDPDAGSGNVQKQAFAAWNATQNDEFAYICWDTDITPTESVPATGSLGFILKQNGNSGTCLIYEPSDLNLAAFICGAAASINFNQAGGRITFAYKSQSGLTASVTTSQTAVNLGGNPQNIGDFGNGYNYYGAIGAANAGFVNFQRGTVTGPFKWLDSYINQVWLNSLMQETLLNFLTQVNAVPFNQAGAGQIENALAAPIGQGLSFGAYAPGALDGSQIAEVNTDAGANIAGTLQTQGYYLQVLQQSSAVRQNRGPWEITFYYLDRGAVQSISLSSVAIQ